LAKPGPHPLGGGTPFLEGTSFKLLHILDSWAHSDDKHSLEKEQIPHLICICIIYCYWLYSLRRARMWGKTWSFALSAHRTTKKKEEKQRR